MTNPFTLAFGKEPLTMIDRNFQLSEIEDSFLSENPSSQIYMITGVRGSGKTVSLTTLYKSFKKRKDWIVVELNSSINLLNQLVSELYEVPSLTNLFIEAKIDLSAFGIGVSLEKSRPIINESTAIERMLNVIKKKNKKLLICIDEATNNENMKIFASTFQILIRHDLPLFLIMTGLPNEIDLLQNVDTLTFLYRAPKISLNKLNMLSISNSYKDTLNISDTKAKELAKLTNGYAFAYQTIGFLYYRDKKINLDEFDSILSERVYEKIWSELPEKEREIVRSIAKGNTTIKEIREDTKISSSDMSTYRIRLNKKGIVDTSERGKITFILPRFAEVILTY